MYKINIFSGNFEPNRWLYCVRPLHYSCGHFKKIFKNLITSHTNTLLLKEQVRAYESSQFSIIYKQAAWPIRLESFQEILLLTKLQTNMSRWS